MHLRNLPKTKNCNPQVWKPWEEDFLRLTYCCTPVKDISEILKRNTNAIYGKANKLKLKHSLHVRKHITDKYYSAIKYKALERNLEFNVTPEFLEELLEQQRFRCALSGMPLHISTRRIRGVLTKSSGSLDRKDSSRGYTEDNVWWVHKTINFMKQSLSVTQFINYCKVVVKHNEPN